MVLKEIMALLGQIQDATLISSGEESTDQIQHLNRCLSCTIKGEPVEPPLYTVLPREVDIKPKRLKTKIDKMR